MIVNNPDPDTTSEMLWQGLIKPILSSRVAEFRRDVRQAFMTANPGLGEKRSALYDEALEVAAQDLIEGFHTITDKVVQSLAEDEEALATWSRLLSGPDGPVISRSIRRGIPVLNDVAKGVLQTAGISAHRAAVQACIAAQE